jgi:hypothetical protein
MTPQKLLCMVQYLRGVKFQLISAQANLMGICQNPGIAVTITNIMPEQKSVWNGHHMYIYINYNDSDLIS